MYVAELTYPGTWLDHPDRDQAREIEGMLHNMESQLDEAAVALHFFEQAQRHVPEAPTLEQWQSDMDRCRELEAGYRLILHGKGEFDRLDRESEDELRHLADVGLKREKWNNGNLPNSYEHSVAFIHAKSFLYSLDMLAKMMRVLSEMDGVPTKVGDVKAEFETDFPDLKNVRDSVQHMEDRGRRLDRKKKPLKLKPIDNSMIHAPQGALVLNSLNNNVFGTTMNDGKYGKVKVSRRSLMKAQARVQEAIDCFTWSGPKRHHPY